MNLLLELFGLLVGLIAAAGAAAALVGFIDLIAGAPQHGMRWLFVVALPLITLLVMMRGGPYLGFATPERAVTGVATLLALAAPVYYCWRFWPDTKRGSRLFFGGLAASALAALLLYGVGPMVARQAAAALHPTATQEPHR